MTAKPDFSGFRVWRQGELDYACGLYCLYSYARHVRSVPETLELDPFPALAKLAGSGIMRGGLDERRLSRAAEKLGLKLDLKVSTPKAEELKTGVWLVGVGVDFVDPCGNDKTEQYNHCVLLLTVDDESGALIADPHPWRAALSYMHLDELARLRERYSLHPKHWAVRIVERTPAGRQATPGSCAAARRGV